MNVTVNAIGKATQSRRLVKCEDSPLQILVLMSALGLARGQGNADQFTSLAVGNWWMTATCTVLACVLGGIFIWIMNFKKVEPNKNDAATQAGEGDGDDDESIPEESEEERNRRYLNAEMIEVSDPELWMNLHHQIDEDEDSEENAEEAELDATQLRILQALDSDDDRISSPAAAIAMWLLARLNRRIAEAEPVPGAEGEGRVAAHQYFQDNNPVYGLLTQVDSQVQEIQDMQAESLARYYDNAHIHGDQEEMWAIQDQIDWWTTVL